MPSGLGRGLGSLIPDKAIQAKINIANKQSGKTTLEDSLQVSVDLIQANPEQPREVFDPRELEDLTNSIKLHGVLQPLVVTKIKDGYQLLAGERRLRASKLAGLKKVPVVINKAETKEEKLIIALVENLQRKDLNVIEEARGYQQLLNKHKLTQVDLAKLLGKSRPSITNALRMLKLPEPVKAALSKGTIGRQHAKLIAGMDGEKVQLALLQKIVDGKLTKRAATIEGRKMGGTRSSKIKYFSEDKKREEQLSQALQCEVFSSRRANNICRIIINFTSDDKLDEFIRKLVK